MTRLDDAREHARRLHEMRQTHLDKLTEISADDRWSDTHRERLIAEERADFAAQSKASASRAWRATNRLLTDAQADLKTAAQTAVASVDDARVAAKIAIYQAEIRAAKAAENPITGTTVYDYLSARRDELAQADDRDALAALRLAAAPVLQGVDTRDEGRFPKAAAVMSTFKADEQAAQPVEVRQFEQEVSEIEGARAGLRRLVLDVQDTALNQTRDPVFGGLSEWERDVLGETHESSGRIVWTTAAD